MTIKLKKGDPVKWKVGKGEAKGKITQKLTQSTQVDGKEIQASKSKPRYLVKNESTGSVISRRARSLSLIENEHNLKPQQHKILDNFHEAVNMSASELKAWLKTEESNSVGQKDRQGKIKGRKSGKKIIKILNKKQSEYQKKDFKHMKKVVSYIHRHLAQKPSGNIQATPWQYSLMNWGHDPMNSKTKQ
ncbi:DUF2945 domain-containing protein [Pleurocapsa sp. CCALA 161]|uniref:HVA1 family protein n=1 Tax=Pleurocapsa sp. CCALA 161 TaxID=2107688 RepID=UPI000D07BF31|nr:HVA1 family protein [Pleurocapsa sp. CCALA 161]PSB07419.1 DUF2945 domain-containing protein [Pleurocapsa sp. CCALA 161]